MQTIISDLVGRFERGGLTRRQLIQALSVLVTGGGASRAVAAQTSAIRASGIDHVSVLVGDLERSAQFYQGTFGMSRLSEDKPNQILRLGMKRTIVSLRHESTSGLVDHFCIGIDNFNEDAATQELKQHGLTPHSNVQFGFHVKDPDGVNVQMISTSHRGF
jgi:catechol 2,3-dioxygenase-like lactoylglutathione lyase family enzyme